MDVRFMQRVMFPVKSVLGGTSYDVDLEVCFFFCKWYL